MNLNSSIALAAIALAVSLPVQAANYSYHGELMDGDTPAEGRYDLRVRSFADRDASRMLAPATELASVMLVAGSFSVELDLPEDADGTSWVEVAVRRAQSGDDYEALGDPIAVTKGSATCPGAWALDGNSGLPAGSFLGIADPASAQALELRARNAVAVRFQPSDMLSLLGEPVTANVIAGSNQNTVTLGVRGATIAGGGAPDGEDMGYLGPARNRVTDHYGVVGGGYGNRSGDDFNIVSDSGFGTIAGGRENIAHTYAAVGGGQRNHATAYAATIAGGEQSKAPGYASTVSGGSYNCAGGDFSWAGGRRAKVRDSLNDPAGCGSGPDGDDRGSFIWADSQNADFSTAGRNQFVVRADGGVGINTARFGNAVDLRQSELVLKNSTVNPNTDMTLLSSTNRGYGLAVVPGSAGAAGEFSITETDARTASVVFTTRLRINAAGTTFVQGGAVGNLSDARLKKNVGAIDSPLDTLLALHGRTFEYIDPASSMNAPGQRMGFIAQDVQKAIPGWVAPTGADGYLAVTPIGFEALTVEAIRDLKAESEVRIEQLDADSQAQIARLDAENADLRAALKTLAARLARVEAATRGRE